jgi:integron integrase
MATRLPVVLNEGEVGHLLAAMKGTMGLVARMLYGTGLRLRECLRLRVKDLDLSRLEIVVREGKGRKDRITMLPASLVQPLRIHLGRVQALHQNDLKEGHGEVSLPDALALKYRGGGKLWGWQWVFPSAVRSTEPGTGILRRHHLYPESVQRTIKTAARAIGLAKPVCPHALRHSFATHLLASGHDIRTIQELLGHRSVETTMIYTHVLNRGGHGVPSPLDRIPWEP